MSSSQIVDPNALKVWSAKVEYKNSAGAWVNIGGANGITISKTTLVYRTILDNAKTPAKTKTNWVELTLDMAEYIREDILEELTSPASKVTTPATQQTAPTESLGTGWVVNQAITLKFQNADNTLVANVVIKADNVNLTLNTDYRLSVDDQGRTIVIPVTPQTWVLTADYDYTPNATVEFTYDDKIRDINYLEFRITNETEESAVVITINRWFISNDAIETGFVADEANEEVALTSITITWEEDSNGNIFTKQLVTKTA